MPLGFCRDKEAIYFQPPESDSTTPEPIHVCDDLKIEAETSDETHHAHGLLLSWNDRNGHPHHWAMPLAMVHDDGNGIAKALANGNPVLVVWTDHALLAHAKLAAATATSMSHAMPNRPTSASSDIGGPQGQGKRRTGAANEERR